MAFSLKIIITHSNLHSRSFISVISSLSSNKLFPKVKDLSEILRVGQVDVLLTFITENRVFTGFLFVFVKERLGVLRENYH